ncbi:ABC transporter substrate-binding protein [Nocardiopsis sp. NPDC058789]|uniref:ABC transporter substrate-binding protein n=1 Tax=Nocardiopsis sp. NPDC058789 TaxID=3346634 RepID=UPI00366F6FC8
MPPCERRSRAPLAASGTALVLSLTACTGASTVDDGVEGASAAGSGSLSAGYVGSIDQLGLPIAAETGTFEDHGLDVTLAAPFPTGVDAINALEAGDVDVIQVGVPGLAALDSGVDLVIVGHYSGSAAQRNVDDTMSLVAVEDADIDPEDLTTLEGRTIATSLGTINHLYLLALLEEEGVDPEDVDLVNTAPPDMPVALETGGADAAVAWDPWPLTVTDQVESAWEVVRGGGYLPYVGYVMTTPEYLAGNGETVRAFLTAAPSPTSGSGTTRRTRPTPPHAG